MKSAATIKNGGLLVMHAIAKRRSQSHCLSTSPITAIGHQCHLSPRSSKSSQLRDQRKAPKRHGSRELAMSTARPTTRDRTGTVARTIM